MFDSNLLILGQALGFVSYALGILCFYQKDDKKLKLIMLTMNVNNSIHFALLGAATASLGSILSVFRTGLALRTSSRAVAFVFIAITLASGYWLAETWRDAFPILGTCIGTYALFCLRGIKMRIAFLCGALCWLTNNIIVGSIGGTLLEITLLIVNGNTIRKLYFNREQ
ncbi:YgjV family protein [Saccharophagus degradans]|uniref:YgjV family protein n=1 Tax=Saccharophagus degradans TaxID=86304 RepID=A0AAW7XAS8_9GAMM|nr:YgjV family protein [Saccharophagus degradans]MDO6424773.1 YgjV family protein [Saccharophagus degradans]MDO6609657.1 YgjV family protein [Saccharophagus degradans]